MASTSRSMRSVNFSPRPEKTLMPLSSNGLCEAEMTAPRSYPAVRVKYATAGVGTTPAVATSAPSLAAPWASSASIQSPDSRVSRPMSSLGGLTRRGNTRTSAPPRRRTVDRSSGATPATPRTPSVPNKRGTVKSVSGTGDTHLDSVGYDAGNRGVGRRINVDGEEILAGAEAGEVDKRVDRIGFDAADALERCREGRCSRWQGWPAP